MGDYHPSPRQIIQNAYNPDLKSIRIVDQNVTVFGESVTARRTHDVSVAFNYNISDHDVSTTITGTGTAVHDQNTLKITPGTGVGFSSVQSHNTIAYRPGSEGFAMFTACFESGGEAGLDQGAGLMDPDNGFFFGFNGTDFGVARRKAGVDTWTVGNDLNGVDLTWLDTSKLNIYMIRYGWLGIAPISYYVYYGPTKSWVLIHETDLTNKQILPHINTPTLPVCIYSERTSGAGIAAIIRSSSWRGGVVDGTGADFHRHFSKSNTKTGITSTLTNIFTLRNKSTYQSVANKVAAALEVISIASDGTKNVEIHIHSNATLGGTPVWNDIETNNSVMEIDVAGTTLTGGEPVFIVFLGKADSRVIDLIPYNYRWHPGDTLTFAAKTASGTSDISYSVNWGEIF